jgi:hypothetical protein
MPAEPQPSGRRATPHASCFIPGLMYAGVINQQIVYCCHPVVIMGRTGMAASFGDVEDALHFLMKRGFGLGTVYRHSGSNWDKVEVDPRRVLDRWTGSAVLRG